MKSKLGFFLNSAICFFYLDKAIIKQHFYSVLPSLLFLLSTLLYSSILKAYIPELGSYLRVGSGTHLDGGVQECLSNSGAWGNEFRFGNECETYGELYFKVKDPKWSFFTTFAFVYPNNKDWEAPNANVWVQRELYVEIPFGTNGQKIWMGKRFYRWGDVHMQDFYPVDMSGPGVGYQGPGLFKGQLHLAYMQNSTSTEINGSSNIETAHHKPTKSSLHLRLEELKPSWLEGSQASVWGVVAHTSANAKKTDQTSRYKASTGYFFAAKLNSPILGGYNELGYAMGKGNMSGMSVSSDLVVDCSDDISNEKCRVEDSLRYRIWNSFVWDFAQWSGQFIATFDDYDRGVDPLSASRWSSVGVRPIYWLNDQWGIMGQLGYSTVTDDKDALGQRTLWRMTVGPQLTPSKGYWVRPALRFYYTKTFWSENNPVDDGKYFEGQTSQDAIGFKAEIWF